VKPFLKTFIILGMAFAFSMHLSADTVWDLSATFQDFFGADTATATGTFTLDPSFDFVSYDITVTGGFPGIAGNYNSSGGSDAFISPSHDSIDFQGDSFPFQFLGLNLQSPVTSAGGTINLNTGFIPTGSIACSTALGPCESLVKGSITDAPSATPEPSTILLCVPALLGIALFRRRKATANQLAVS